MLHKYKPTCAIPSQPKIIVLQVGNNSKQSQFTINCELVVYIYIYINKDFFVVEYIKKKYFEMHIFIYIY